MQTNHFPSASGARASSPLPASNPVTSTSKPVSGGFTEAGKIHHVIAGSHDVASLAKQMQLENKGKISDQQMHDLTMKLTAKMRARVASSIHSTMMATGTDWEYLHNTMSAKDLSRHNMRALYRELKNLEEPERDFLKRFYATPLYITHATNQNVLNEDGTAQLYSRKKLQERGIAFPTNNTNSSDLDILATDDHVFFALEQGDAGEKELSRFGSTMHRFPFEQPAVEQQSLMHLFDPLTKRFPSAPKWLEGFDKLNEVQQTEALDTLAQHGSMMNTLNSFFHGPHIKPGLALSIIERCRTLPQPMRDDLLKKADINKLINGLYRPQILVPRHFFGKPSDTRKITDGGLPDLTAASLLDQLMMDSNTPMDSPVVGPSFPNYDADNLHIEAAAILSSISQHMPNAAPLQSAENWSQASPLTSFNPLTEDLEAPPTLQSLYGQQDIDMADADVPGHLSSAEQETTQHRNMAYGQKDDDSDATVS